MKTKSPSLKAGFTLIELLVVIAIIGILSAIVLVSLTSARQKAANAVTLQEVRQIQIALELYYNDNGQYPDPGDGYYCIGSDVCYLDGQIYTNRLTLNTPPLYVKATLPSLFGTTIAHAGYFDAFNVTISDTTNAGIIYFVNGITKLVLYNQKIGNTTTWYSQEAGKTTVDQYSSNGGGSDSGSDSGSNGGSGSGSGS